MKQGEIIELVNAGDASLYIRKVTCWSMDGRVLTSNAEEVLEPGKSLPVNAEQQWSSGLYFVRVELIDGMTWGTRVFME